MPPTERGWWWRSTAIPATAENFTCYSLLQKADASATGSLGCVEICSLLMLTLLASSFPKSILVAFQMEVVTTMDRLPRTFSLIGLLRLLVLKLLWFHRLLQRGTHNSWTSWATVFRARIYTVLGDKSLMIVNIEGSSIDVVGDSHTGSSHVCKWILTEFDTIK